MPMDQQSYDNFLRYKALVAANPGMSLLQTMDGFKAVPVGEAGNKNPNNPNNTVFQGYANDTPWSTGSYMPLSPNANELGWDSSQFGDQAYWNRDDTLPNGQKVSDYLSQIQHFSWPNYSSAPSDRMGFGDILGDALKSPGFGGVLAAAGAGTLLGGGGFNPNYITGGPGGASWTSGYDLAGGGSLGGGLGGSNVSGFFDDILNDFSGNLSFDPATMEGPGNDFLQNFINEAEGPAGAPSPNTDWTGLNPTNNTFTPSFWERLIANRTSLPRIPGLPGSDGGSGSGSGSGKSILDSIFGENSLLSNGLGTLAGVAPSLAAINYAQNLDGPDTSRLESAYSSVDPNSLALPYDIQTGKGRESLTSSLSSRGVMGSSFGDADIASYDTLRGLGRSSLLTQGAGTQASIASQILQAQQAAQKNKLDLYGRSLLALSGGLSPSKTSAFAGLF